MRARSKVPQKEHGDICQVQQDHIHPFKQALSKKDVRNRKKVLLEIRVFLYFDRLLVILQLNFVHDLMLL